MPMNSMVPPTQKEKDKIIGGKIDLTQLIWLFMGIMLGAGFLVIFSILFNFILGVFLALPFLLIGIPFAFMKKFGMPLFTFIKTRKEFEKSQKFIKLNVRRDA